MSKSYLITINMVTLVLMFSFSTAHAFDFSQVRKLIADGKNQQAYQLLEPFEFEFSGDEEFDLLFGFTALKVGYVSLSTLAFERVLSVNSSNKDARYYLAVAYYSLSDFDGARREFELLLSLNPTSGIRATVGQYLDAIAARKPSSKTNFSGFVSLGFGSDSNVTGATSQSSVFFTGLDLDYTLPVSEVEDDDRYKNISAGLTVVHEVAENSSVYVGGDLSGRFHKTRDELDYSQYMINSGYRHSFGNNSTRLGLTGAQLSLDGETYQRSNLFDAEWRITVRQRTQFAIIGSFSQYQHFPSENNVSDYNDSKLKLSFLRIFGEKGRHTVSATVGAGKEVAENDRADGDLNYSQFSLIGQMQFSNTISGFIQFSQQSKKYNEISTLFTDKRKDLIRSSVIGSTYRISELVSLSLMINVSETDSNLSLYDSDRKDLSFSLRKDFL